MFKRRRVDEVEFNGDEVSKALIVLGMIARGNRVELEMLEDSVKAIAYKVKAMINCGDGVVTIKPFTIVE